MAATAFRLLLVAFAVSVVVGPNRVFLIAIGKNRLILIINVIMALFSVVANVILIPAAGLDGAALAAALTIMLSNGLTSGYLWLRLGIQPFTRMYLVLIVFGLLAGGLLGWISVLLGGTSLAVGVLFGLFYSGVLVLWVWKGGFLDDEDRELGAHLLNVLQVRRLT